MILSLIAAMDRNRVIGAKNKMPWHLPADLKYFKRMTLGKSIIMGRRTFESLPGPLPGRTNIILSRYPDRFLGQDVHVYVNWESIARRFQYREDAEVMVIGGSMIFEMTLPIAQRLYLTRIDHAFEGDRYFPAWDPALWQCVSREPHAADASNPYDYCFETWEKVSPSSTGNY